MARMTEDFQFTARIDGSEVECRLIPAHDLKGAVLCYSAISDNDVLEGGETIEHVANFNAVALPDIPEGAAHILRFRYAQEGVVPLNRAWLPISAYLRTPSGIIPLPALKTGVIPAAQDPVPCTAPLKICPQVKAFTHSDASLQFTALKVAGEHDALDRADGLMRRCGFGALLSDTGTPAKITHDPSLADEGYTLDIMAQKITIRSKDEAGLFYAALTLGVLRLTHYGVLPCGTITDHPRFEWRGQHLDCARHFYEVETILRLLDLMALMKFNRFHWHFADDEGFRVELKSLPELQKSHYRGEGMVVPAVFGGLEKDGGFYSHADVARVVAHARALNIEVMPEIEVPAHSWALTRIYPATRDPQDQSHEVSVQGYAENVMNPAMDDTWRIWEAMIQELSELFPFSIIHLGGDELPPGTWAKSPAAQELMRENGLKTQSDLLGWTMHKLAARLGHLGKTAGAWEEAALGVQGGIGHDAILFSWTGKEPGYTAAKRGYRVVMTPAQHVYLDMRHTGDPDDWGAGWAAIVGLSDTINWKPVPDENADYAQNIIGVQGTFWSEFTTIDRQIEPMLAPRILGVAMMGWQDTPQNDPHMLLSLSHVYEDVFERMNWQTSIKV